MTDEYIRREDILDAFGLSEKTRKYDGDHSGYDTRMLYEIQDTIESLEPADVVSKADITALLEEIEKELVKDTDERSPARCIIVSIMGIVKYKIMQMGEGKE